MTIHMLLEVCLWHFTPVPQTGSVNDTSIPPAYEARTAIKGGVYQMQSISCLGVFFLKSERRYTELIIITHEYMHDIAYNRVLYKA